MAFYHPLNDYCTQLIRAFDQIQPDRRESLKELIDYIQEKIGQEEVVKLNFICTHNSRRSQFGQVWAKLAGIYFKIPQVQTYSGGTEVTACNPRTIAALQRAGLQIEKEHNRDETLNPRYMVHLPDDEPPIYLYSKVYHAPGNPQNKFCAITVCSAADAACPLVTGAEKRIYHGYDDPKEDDDTSREAQSYDHTCRLIAREMFYVFSLVKKGLTKVMTN